MSPFELFLSIILVAMAVSHWRWMRLISTWQETQDKMLIRFGDELAASLEREIVRTK